jgi:hypothetical protein
MEMKHFKTRLIKQRNYILNKCYFPSTTDYKRKILRYSLDYSIRRSLATGLEYSRQKNRYLINQLGAYFWDCLKNKYPIVYEIVKDDSKVCEHGLAKKYFQDFNWDEAEELQLESEDKIIKALH